MSAIELLAEYVRLRKRIRLLQAQINVKREIAEALSGWPEGERVQSSHDPDKIGRAVADLADREDELIKLKLEAIDHNILCAQAKSNGQTKPHRSKDNKNDIIY